MARIRYREIEFRDEATKRIAQVNQILTQYKQRVSVRQVYYRLVAAGLIPNTQKEYAAVQDLLTRARYAGLVDWDAIEDRNREPEKRRDWASARDLVLDAAKGFRLDRWEGQPFYVECWVEKAALAGVLAPVADDYHVTLMVNRGYSSASAMKESADRIRARCAPRGPHERPVILYVGDHDPSGEDMVRDVMERLIEFGVPDWLDVRKVALTMAQVEEYDPPPNPAKMSDSRAAAYAEKHGESSWEVDALPPDTLDVLLRKTVNSYVDKAKMDAQVTRENVIKQRLKMLAAHASLSEV
ncbi:MAG: hypothetical protein KGK07_14700 [Chloroflexota bacterium]|nr:hypothetical protein [Chloroflexota bacterium]